MLSHFRPAPECLRLQSICLAREGGPALIRNFDYPPSVASDRFRNEPVVRVEGDREGATPLGRLRGRE